MSLGKGLLHSVIVLLKGDSEAASPGQNDENNVLDAGVACELPFRAEGLVDLALHVLARILHEDRRVGVAL